MYYLGFPRDNGHQSFLANICDRASLKLITSDGSSLYSQDLASVIKETFADLLEGEEAEDEVNDTESEGEDP